MGNFDEHHWGISVSVIEPVGQVVLAGGVVGLRRRHLGLEQHPTVDRQPLSFKVCALLATATWVCRSGRRPGCPMRERRRHQSPDVDLPHPTLALTAEQGVLLEEPQRVRHRRVVGLLDLRRGVGSATAHRVDTDFTGEKVRS